MTHLIRQRLWRCAAAFLLACVPPLHAHSGPGQAIQAELVEQSSLWGDVTLQLRRSLAPQMLIANRSHSEVEILDQHGRAFVRISPQGVFADLASAAWYNTYSTAGLTVPPKARDPHAPVQWQQVSSQPQWGWFDPRLSTEELEPPGDLVSEGREARFGHWTIPARIDGEFAPIHGRYLYTPPQSGQRKTSFSKTSRAAEGVSVQLISGPVDAFMLQNRSDKTVTVLGLEGEPFLRMGGKRVEANLASPTWREWGRVQLTAAGSAGSEQWQLISRGWSFTWLDPRTLLPGAQASQSDWTLPMIVGDHVVELAGQTERVEPIIEHSPAADEQHDAMAGMAHHDHAAMIGVEVKGAVPRLSVRAEPDAVSGWNIQLMVENFRFAPEHVNQAHQEGEGHAHIYVDGQKIARVYGAWHHLGELGSGPHTLKVELNANTHAKLMHQGRPIAVSLVLQQL